MSPTVQSLHRKQLLIGLSLMIFATICIHGICQSNQDNSLSSPSPSLPPSFQDPSTPSSSIETLTAQLRVLEANYEKLAQTVAELQTTMTRGQPQYVMTDGEVAFLYCIFPIGLWIIAFGVFVDGANRISKEYMMNTLPAAFFCVNVGMAYLVFGMKGSDVKWYYYVLGTLWPVQGALIASMFVKEILGGAEVVQREGEKKD